MHVYDQRFSGHCIRMRPSRANQCYAIAELVRPWEVADLIQDVPRWMLPRGHSLAADVARWLGTQLSEGTLRYIADPVRPYGYDHWCSPAATLERGGGDCDDLAILGASLLLAGGVDAWVVVGTFRQGWRAGGHAWIEGVDERGGFLIEATSGRLVRHMRPPQYQASLLLGPGSCERAA